MVGRLLPDDKAEKARRGGRLAAQEALPLPGHLAKGGVHLAPFHRAGPRESRARHPKGSGEPGSLTLPRPPLRPRARALRAPGRRGRRALPGLHGLGGGGPGRGHFRPLSRRGPRDHPPTGRGLWEQGSPRLGPGVSGRGVPAPRGLQSPRGEDVGQARPAAGKARVCPPGGLACVAQAALPPEVAESRSRRVVKLASNRAARLAAGFLEQAKASSVVIGEPSGVRDRDAGAVQNRRTHRWLVVHTTRALCYRLEEVGTAAELTEESGTSSHCPDCGAVAKERGRVLVCTGPACGTVHHRDVAGAQNMVRKLGRAPSLIAHIEHRRVGTPARRDQRRVSDELPSRRTPKVPARTRATTVASAGVESLVA